MGLFDHLHIKGSAAGSPNELSFDVLDNARKGLNTGRKSRGFGLGSTQGRGRHASSGNQRLAPEGNMPFTRGTVIVTSSDEMLQRPGRRGGNSLGGSYASDSSHAGALHGLGSIALYFFAAISIIALICAAVLINRQLYMERMDFTNRLVGLAGEISKIDKELVQIDVLARNSLASESRKELPSALGKLPGIESELTGIQEKIALINADEPAGYNPVALKEVQSAVSARIELITNAAKLLEEASQAQALVASAESAWQLVIDSIELSKQGIESANKATNEASVKESRAQIAGAVEGLKTASQQLQALQRDVQELNLGAQLRYLDTKIAALEFELKVDDALLSQNREAATEANLAYNAKEDEAAEQAGLITAPPPASVLELLQKSFESKTELYNDAREKVIAADSALRMRLA